VAVDPNAGQAGSPLYRVTRVEDSTMLGASGGFQRSKKVWYVLSDGTSSYVEIPLSGFTRDNVANLIDQHVGDLLDVLTIAGPSIPGPT
jgi:hypothetical protein